MRFFKQGFLAGMVALSVLGLTTLVSAEPVETAETEVSEEEAPAAPESTDSANTAEEATSTEATTVVTANAEKAVDSDSHYQISVTTSEEMEDLKVKMSDKWIVLELEAETDAGYTYSSNAKFVMHDGREGKIFIKEDASTKKIGAVTFRNAGDGFSGVAEKFAEAADLPSEKGTVATGRKSYGGRGRYKDCYGFIRAEIGYEGSPVGNSMQGLQPGNVLHMQGYRWGSHKGKNHWAIVEYVDANGYVHIAHSNVGGNHGTVRNALHMNSFSGRLTVHQGDAGR